MNGRAVFIGTFVSGVLLLLWHYTRTAERRITAASFAAWMLVSSGFGIALWALRNFTWTGISGLDALGSFFQGSVVALWTLAAFAFAYIAFLQQQIQMQRHDAELRRTNEELQRQRDETTRERFEQTFFKMLDLHHRLVESTAIINPNDFHHILGRAALSMIWATFEFEFEHSQGDERERLDNAYLNTHEKFESALGHYFRNLYHIVLFVDESAVTSKTKYTKILRAQLSSTELLLLFYNGLSEFGREKFKPLIEKYALLEQVPNGDLPNVQHKDFYDEAAFQDSHEH